MGLNLPQKTISISWATVTNLLLIIEQQFSLYSERLTNPCGQFVHCWYHESYSHTLPDSNGSNLHGCISRVTRKHWLPVRGPPYGPGPWTTLRTGPRTPFTDPPPPPLKIAEKENKQEYKQKWQKDFTDHLNGLSACVDENSNVYFRKINRLGRKVILIAYFAVAMYERTQKTCVLWRLRIHLHTVLPPPFCSAQSPAFAITNSTQASRKTTWLSRLVSSFMAAIDDQWEFVNVNHLYSFVQTAIAMYR